MKMAYIILASFMAVASWELILRVALWRQPEFKILPKGVVAQPGSSSVRSQEGFSRRDHINEFGTFHSIRLDLPLIVLQGDSYTYAEQVGTEENYASLVRQEFYDQFEILNAGNFGMNVAHYVYNARYFQSYKPVFHIIQVKFDDFLDSFGSQEPLHFKFEGDQLAFETYRTDFMKWVEEHPEVYNFLNQISVLSYFRDKYLQDVNAWVKNFGQKNTPVAVELPPPEVGTKSSQAVSSQNEKWEKNRGKFRIQLEKLKAVYGSQFAILYLPRVPIMKNKELILDDPEEVFYHQMIKDLCAELKIPVISMWDPFYYLYQRKNVLFSGFRNTTPGVGHLNASGHKLVADEVSKFLREQIEK